MGFLNKILNSLVQNKADKNSNTEQSLYDRYSWEDKNYLSASKKYFDGMEEIETNWSVLYNLNCFTGARADKFIADCKKNINDFYSWQEIAKTYGEDSPPSVPAFKRLAMIYEKQGLYENSIAVCREAILACACSDGTKGGMKGRLARMIKKSGRTPTDEEMILLN